MASSFRRRDNKLIDALEAIKPVEISKPVWRVVRFGRDPTRCSASAGRWDDGTFDVLYTACEADGAIAEMRFHLMRGQPVMPSKISYELYELNISLKQILRLIPVDALAPFGVDVPSYGRMPYVNRQAEYAATQVVGEVAYFLDCDGVLVPGARHDSNNVVMFCGHTAPTSVEVVKSHGRVEW